MMTALEEENQQVLVVIQALLGAIAPNFREVSLVLAPENLHLYFVLEHESAEDREEIEEVRADVDLDQSWGPDTHVQPYINIHVLVCAGEPLGLPANRRLVFKRKEPHPVVAPR